MNRSGCILSRVLRNLVLALLLFFIPSAAVAEPVNASSAVRIAINWALMQRQWYGEQIQVGNMEAVSRNGIVLFYVFELQPQGYVLISADDHLPPVKMYSLNNRYGAEGRVLEDLVIAEYSEIIAGIVSGELNPQRIFAADNRRRTRLLSSAEFSLQQAAVIAPAREIRPLLSTRWSQGEPYNLFCPWIDGRPSFTGCVATAFAQIMKYWAYPDRGRGQRTYTTATHGILVSVSLEAEYIWSRMLDEYPRADSGDEEERLAVSRLMRDVGVVLGMDYSPDGSGASPYWAVVRFPYHFAYSSGMTVVGRSGLNDAAWFDLARTQLDAALPVYFTIATTGADRVGHGVVIDGYRDSGLETLFHINMGWGGSWDGYYAPNNIVVRDERYAFTCLESQRFVLNMVPPRREAELPAASPGAVKVSFSLPFFRKSLYVVKWKGVTDPGLNVKQYAIFHYSAGMWIGSRISPHTGANEHLSLIWLPEPDVSLFEVSAVLSDGNRLWLSTNGVRSLR